MDRQANRGASKPHRQRPDDQDKRDRGELTDDTIADRLPSTETENQRQTEEARSRRMEMRRPGVRCIPTAVLVRDSILRGPLAVFLSRPVLVSGSTIPGTMQPCQESSASSGSIATSTGPRCACCETIRFTEPSCLGWLRVRL